MRRARSDSGFTLFELIVVLLIMGVVSTIGLGAFFNVTGAWRKSTYRMELGSAAETVLDRLRDDVRRVVSSRRTGYAIQGFDVLNNDVRYDDLIRLEDDRIVLPMLRKDADGKTERLAIQYHVDRSDGRFMMTRTFGPMGSEAPAGAREAIVPGVLTFELAYLEAGVWHAAWSKPQNPEAIRASVTVQGEYPRNYEQISRTATFPIHAK